MCQSSGKLNVCVRHWYFSLCVGGWPAGWDETGLIPTSRKDSQPIISEKYQCRTHTLNFPDDGNIDARNMYRSRNKFTKK